MEKQEIKIPKPNFEVRAFPIVGITPLVMHRFSEKAKQQIKASEESGSQKKKKGTKKKPRDYAADYEGAKHVSTEGWIGFPASAFRAAMIRACNIVGFVMTQAKMSLFIVEDGISMDGIPLVKIEGEPERYESMVRIGMSQTTLAVRPMFKKWAVQLRVRYDADIFSEADVANLLLRAGMQVGIGEGRPFSKKSDAGMGWGTFTIEGLKEK